MSGISSSESSSGKRPGKEDEKLKSSISSKQLNPSSNQAKSSHEFYDYHAKSLPDPKLDSEGSSGRESSTNSGNETDIKFLSVLCSNSQNICTNQEKDDEAFNPKEMNKDQ